MKRNPSGAVPHQNTDDCKTKYPLLFLHGIGFRDGKKYNYWGRIPGILKEHGAQIFYGGQSVCGTIPSNALFLKEKIREILHVTNAGKINIIAHSKGGLEARYLISSLHMAECVASLTTIATPHLGSKSMEWLLRDHPGIMRLVTGLFDLEARLLGDQHPESKKAFCEVTPESMSAFNKENPDAPEVFYQSYAFAMKQPSSDFLFSLFNHIIDKREGPNDGLVSTSSAQWGEFKGVVTGKTNRGISHMDATDLRRRQFSKGAQGEGVEDITAFYLALVRGLKEKGY